MVALAADWWLLLAGEGMNDDGGLPPPDLYGAAFYFDEEVDFVRCTSMTESFSVLHELFQHQISCVSPAEANAGSASVCCGN